MFASSDSPPPLPARPRNPPPTGFDRWGGTTFTTKTRGRVFPRKNRVPLIVWYLFACSQRAKLSHLLPFFFCRPAFFFTRKKRRVPKTSTHHNRARRRERQRQNETLQVQARQKKRVPLNRVRPIDARDTNIYWCVCSGFILHKKDHFPPLSLRPVTTKASWFRLTHPRWGPEVLSRVHRLAAELLLNAQELFRQARTEVQHNAWRGRGGGGVSVREKREGRHTKTNNEARTHKTYARDSFDRIHSRHRRGDATKRELENGIKRGATSVPSASNTDQFHSQGKRGRIREEGRAEQRTTKHRTNRRQTTSVTGGGTGRTKMPRVVARESFRQTRGFACPLTSLPRPGPIPSQGLACMLAILGGDE